MKNFFLAFLIVSAFAKTHAQSADTIHSKNANTWAIKGKVLPWMLLGSGINYTLGVEYDFNKVHAIGIDLVYNDNSNEHDVYDSSKKDYVSGPRMYTVARGAFLNYRRYFEPGNSCVLQPLTKIFKEGYLPYVGGFLRYGKTDYHYEAGYVTPQVSYDEWQYSGGVLFGVVYNIIDVNVGPFYKTKYVSDVEMEYGSKVYHSYSQSNFGVRLGVNLFFVAKKRGDHLLAKYGRAAYQQQ